MQANDTKSRVILTYFVNKYGSKDDFLYLSDLVAKVDMILYWILNKLYKALLDIFELHDYDGNYELDEAKERE